MGGQPLQQLQQDDDGRDLQSLVSFLNSIANGVARFDVRQTVLGVPITRQMQNTAMLALGTTVFSYMFRFVKMLHENNSEILHEIIQGCQMIVKPFENLTG